jgi:hypothetical protein
LNKEINAVLAPVVTPMSIAEFKAFVNGESVKYLNVIKETGVTSQLSGRPAAEYEVFGCRRPRTPAFSAISA